MEHQNRFDEMKTLLTEKNPNTIEDPDQPFYAMCDTSNFGIGATLLQSHNGTNKMNLKSANSRFFYTSGTENLYNYECMYSYNKYTRFCYRSETNNFSIYTKIKPKP